MRRRALTSVVAASSLALAAEVAHAETVKHETEVSLLGTYIEPDSDRTDEYGSAVRGMFSIRLSKHWWVEPQFYSGVIETGVNGGTCVFRRT